MGSNLMSRLSTLVPHTEPQELPVSMLFKLPVTGEFVSNVGPSRDEKVVVVESMLT